MKPAAMHIYGVSPATRMVSAPTVVYGSQVTSTAGLTTPAPSTTASSAALGSLRGGLATHAPSSSEKTGGGGASGEFETANFGTNDSHFWFDAVKQIEEAVDQKVQSALRDLTAFAATCTERVESQIIEERTLREHALVEIQRQFEEQQVAAVKVAQRTATASCMSFEEVAKATAAAASQLEVEIARVRSCCDSAKDAAQHEASKFQNEIEELQARHKTEIAALLAGRPTLEDMQQHVAEMLVPMRRDLVEQRERLEDDIAALRRDSIAASGNFKEQMESIQSLLQQYLSGDALREKELAQLCERLDVFETAREGPKSPPPEVAPEEVASMRLLLESVRSETSGLRARVDQDMAELSIRITSEVGAARADGAKAMELSERMSREFQSELQVLRKEAEQLQAAWAETSPMMQMPLAVLPSDGDHDISDLERRTYSTVTQSPRTRRPTDTNTPSSSAVVSASTAAVGAGAPAVALAAQQPSPGSLEADRMAEPAASMVLAPYAKSDAIPSTAVAGDIVNNVPGDAVAAASDEEAMTGDQFSASVGSSAGRPSSLPVGASTSPVPVPPLASTATSPSGSFAGAPGAPQQFHNDRGLRWGNISSGATQASPSTNSGSIGLQRQGMALPFAAPSVVATSAHPAERAACQSTGQARSVSGPSPSSVKAGRALVSSGGGSKMEAGGIALSGSSSQGAGLTASVASSTQATGGNGPLWRRSGASSDGFSGTERSTPQASLQPIPSLGGASQNCGRGATPLASSEARQVAAPTGVGWTPVAGPIATTAVSARSATPSQMQLGLGGGLLMTQGVQSARNTGPSPERARGTLSSSPVRTNTAAPLSATTPPLQALPEWAHMGATTTRSGRVASPRRDMVGREAQPAMPRSISPTPPTMCPAAAMAGVEAAAVYRRF